MATSVKIQQLVLNQYPTAVALTDTESGMVHVYLYPTDKLSYVSRKTSADAWTATLNKLRKTGKLIV